jgi:Holliday junction resolvase
MRARRTDTNQGKLVKEMRDMGMSVHITSGLGSGFPDLVAGFRGINYLFEVKDENKPPSKKRLTPDEQKFFADWNGTVYKIEKIEEVVEIIEKIV